jgi:RNA-dependent RNA polymerase
MHLS